MIVSQLVCLGNQPGAGLLPGLSVLRLGGPMAFSLGRAIIPHQSGRYSVSIGEKFDMAGLIRYTCLCCRGVAQLGSALEWGSRGRAFESPRPDCEGRWETVGPPFWHIPPQSLTRISRNQEGISRKEAKPQKIKQQVTIQVCALTPISLPKGSLTIHFLNRHASNVKSAFATGHDA